MDKNRNLNGSFKDGLGFELVNPNLQSDAWSTALQTGSLFLLLLGAELTVYGWEQGKVMVVEGGSGKTDSCVHLSSLLRTLAL